MAFARAKHFAASGFLALLCLTALPFAFYAVARGLSLPNPEEQLASRFFAPAAPFSSLLIYGHMISGGLITALAPVQLFGPIRRMWPRAHHILGYAVAGLAVSTALFGGMYIIMRGTIGGPVMNLGFGLYGVLMLLCAARAVLLARRRDPMHVIWAERLVILSLASWFYRLHYGLWEIAMQGAGSRPDFSGPFDIVQVFAFYLPYLLLHHWWRKRHPPVLR